MLGPLEINLIDSPDADIEERSVKKLSKILDFNSVFYIERLKNGKLRASVDYRGVNKESIDNIIDDLNLLILEGKQSNVQCSKTNETSFSLSITSNTGNFKKSKKFFKKDLEYYSKFMDVNVGPAIEYLDSLSIEKLNNPDLRIDYDKHEFVLFYDPENSYLFKRIGTPGGIPSEFTKFMKQEQRVLTSAVVRLPKGNIRFRAGIRDYQLSNLMMEAHNHIGRGVAFFQEAEDISCDLDIYNDKLESYRDYERSNRIMSLAARTSLYDFNNEPYQMADLVCLNSDTLLRRGSSAANLFVQKEDYWAAFRFVRRTINQIKDLKKKFNKFSIKLERDFDEDDGYYYDQYNPDELDYSKGEVSTKLGYDIWDVGAVYETLNMRVKTLKTRLNEIIKSIRNDNIKQTPFTINEIPVFERMDFIESNLDFYRNADDVKSLYQKIINEKDYLGFELKESFMFS